MITDTMSLRIRRFEPQAMTRDMLETEARTLQIQFKQQMTLPLVDLRRMLGELGHRWHHADEALRAVVLDLPEQERLVAQFLFLTDLHALVEVHLERARANAPPAPEPDVPVPSPTKIASELFSETLFGH